MTNQSVNVTDLVADGAGKRQTVEERIEQRLVILRQWLREGVPMGKAVPKSLTAARLWEDLELGILPISSPNEFTTTHQIFGPLVRDLAGLLTDLTKRFGRPASSREAKIATASAKYDRRAHERQLEAAVSQWHSERDSWLLEKKRADAAEARSVLLLEENAQKDEIIADLRRQLAAKQGLRVVE